MAGIDLRSPTSGSGASSGSLAPTAVKTAAYTAAASDLVPVDTTSGSVTVTLPTAPPDKTQIGVKHVVRGGANTVSIAAGGTDRFNVTGGSATLTLPQLFQSAVLQYTAATGLWYVVATDVPVIAAQKRTGRVADTAEPWVMLHKGVGEFTGPEHTMEGYRMGVALGSAWVDLDVWFLNDGSWLCYHDNITSGQSTNSMDPTTISGGTIYQTSASISKARFLGSIFWPGYSTDLRIPFLRQVLDEFGGKVPIQIELKNNHGTELAQLIVSRGLEDCVTISSTVLTDLAAVQAVSPNILLGMIANVTPAAFAANTPTVLVTAGVKYLYVRVESGYWTTTDIAAYVAAGLKVVPYFINRQNQLDTWLAAGVVGVYSQDAYVVMSRVPAKVDPFASQMPYPGQQTYESDYINGDQSAVGSPSYRGVYGGTNKNALRLPNHAGGNDFVLQGWACPLRGRSGTLPTTYSITFTMLAESLPSTDLTRSMQVDVCAPTDQQGTSGCLNGYKFGLRANGGIFGVKRVANNDSGTTQSATSTALVAGTGVACRIDVTPTTVKFTRLDTGVNVTITDSAYRGKFFWFGKNEGGTTGGAFDAAFSGVTTP